MARLQKRVDKTTVDETAMLSNPYGKKKFWDGKEEQERGIKGANDSMAYVEKKKYVAFDASSAPKEEEEVEEPEKEAQEPEKPYTKVDYKKRYDDLKRHYDARINEWKQKEEALKAEATASRPKYTPPKSPEELEKWRQDYPEVYDVVETVAHMRASDETLKLQEQLKKVEEQLQYEAARAAFAELKALVPDYEQIRMSDDFHAWAEEQPEEIQNWVYKNRTNAQLAAKAINLYKVDRGGAQPTQQARQEKPADSRGSAADAVNAGKRTDTPSSKERIWKHSEIAAMSLAEYDKKRKEIDRAYTEGRIVPD